MSTILKSVLRPTNQAFIRFHPFAASVAATGIQTRLGHSVKLIAVDDLPFGKGYKGDVVTVKAGYARNYLIPKKMAVYATPQNFEKFGVVDPDFESAEDRKMRLAREASMSQQDEEFLKEADRLKHYLRNKTLKMYRMVDPSTQDSLHPGKVNSWQLRKKLSKQLKIDLEENESLHIYSEPVDHAELDDKMMTSIMEGMDVSEPCTVEIKRLGDYMAKISLEGGFSVPLKFTIVQRN